MKVASVLALVLSILGRKGALAQNFKCPICGDGLEVTNPNAVVSLPASESSEAESRTCAELLATAELGDIIATRCTVVQPFVMLSCECKEIEEYDTPSSAPIESETESDAPSSASTETNATDFPTAAPTQPDCYKELDAIAEIEWALAEEDLALLRTYTLCPDNMFFMGRGNPAVPGTYIGGSEPIAPRSNSHFKCGEDGSRENNCVISGGDFAVVAFGGGANNVNVVFEGIVFEKQFRGGFLLAEAGDFTFIDCVFRDMENIGPFLIIFNSPYVRRLKQDGSTGDRRKDFAELINLIESGGIKDSSYQTNHEESDRDLQVENNDFPSSLTILFKDSVFEGITPVATDAFSRAGIITVTEHETSLIFEGVIFRNNLFGAEGQASTYAVETPGPVTITRSCFENNDFKRLAPIVVIGSPEIIAFNNFGTLDDDLVCPLIGNFQDSDALEAVANYTCLGFDADACQVLAGPTAIPGPSPTPVQPTRKPTPTRTDPPTPEPTDGAFTSSVSRWITSAAFLCALIF